MLFSNLSKTYVLIVTGFAMEYRIECMLKKRSCTIPNRYDLVLSIRIYIYSTYFQMANKDMSRFLTAILSIVKDVFLDNLSTLSVPDQDHSRNASCALNLLSTFLLPSLCRYLCCWTISPRGYHPLSSQFFGTDMVY